VSLTIRNVSVRSLLQGTSVEDTVPERIKDFGDRAVFSQRLLDEARETAALAEAIVHAVVMNEAHAFDDLAKHPSLVALIEQVAEVTHEHHRAMLDFLPAAVFIQLDGSFAFANTLLAKLLGLTDGVHLVGQPVLHYVHSSSRDSFKEMTRFLERDLRATMTSQLRWVTASNDPIDFDLVASGTIFRGQRAVRGIATMRSRIDAPRATGQLTQWIERFLTERRQTSDHGRMMEALSESSSQAVCWIDSTGICQFANRAALKILATTREVVEGKELHALVHPEETNRRDCHLHEVIAFAETWHQTDVFVRADGSRVPVSYTTTPQIRGGVFRGTVLAFADITRATQAEAATQRLRRLDAVTRFAATLIFELEQIQRDIQDGRPAGRHDSLRRHDPRLIRFDRAATQIDDLVQRIRDLAVAPLNFKSLDLGHWLRGAVSWMGDSFDPEVELIFSPPQHKLYINADSLQLTKAVRNLATWLARRLRSTEVSIECTQNIGLSDEREDDERIERYAFVVIRAEIQPIPPESLSSLFEPGVCAADGADPFGLTVAHEIIRWHRGTLSVEANGPKIVFRIHLPLTVPEIVDEVLFHRVDAEGPLRVLVVEAETLSLSKLARSLDFLNLEIGLVSHITDLDDVVGSFRPDLVLINSRCLELEDVEALKRVAAARPDLSFLCANASDDEAPGIKAPNVLYLVYDIETLLHSAEKLSVRK